MTTPASAAAAGTIEIGGDLVVRRMGFGAMRVTGDGIWGDPPDVDLARAALRRAVELGVNFIDTADSYGPEVSERLIAEALHPYPDGLVIATKGGLVRPGPGRWDADGTPGHLRAACEGSLRRLRLDQIPLYQLHRPDPGVPMARSRSSRTRARSGTSASRTCPGPSCGPRSRSPRSFPCRTGTTRPTACRSRWWTRASWSRSRSCHGHRSSRQTATRQ